jgi:hemerythrin
MYIHWDKGLELGNDLIDTQHRILMLLYRKLDMAIKTRESEQNIRRVILELKKFAEFHFISEENLMHEIGYPDVDAHALIHTGLLKQLEMILIQINHHKEFPESLLYFLIQWLTQHALNDDMKITDYLKDSHQRPIGENLYSEYLLSEKTK